MVDNRPNTIITPFQKEQIKTKEKIEQYKLSSEASLVCLLYKNPERISDVNITLDELSSNVWRVYFAIAVGVIKTENKALTEINIGFFLDKHPKLKCKYDEYGGYDTVSNGGKYVEIESFDGNVNEIKKWNTVLELLKFGFPVSEHLAEYSDMTGEEIYRELEGYLNHVFANVERKIQSYDALTDLHELIDKLDKGSEVGLPLKAEMLNKEIGGLRLGNIYSFTGASGAGKSTVLCNYVLPSIIENNERCCMFINEEDVGKVRRELLLYCCANILKKPIQKIQLRDGNFDEETKKTLHEAADWLESQNKNHNITVIPLEQYTVDIVIKLIKKFKHLFDINYFIIDTFKESSNSKEEAWRSMLKDSVKLYDIIKPASLNVCLVITMQTAKASLKNRHLTNADIGQSKSVVDVFSCSILFRRVEPDEYEGGKRELKCFKLEGKNGRSKIPFSLKQENYYLVFFIAKNRFGNTDQYSIVTQINLSTNEFIDVGYCIVPEDW